MLLIVSMINVEEGKDGKVLKKVIGWVNFATDLVLKVFPTQLLVASAAPQYIVNWKS